MLQKIHIFSADAPYFIIGTREMGKKVFFHPRQHFFCLSPPAVHQTPPCSSSLLYQILLPQINFTHDQPPPLCSRLSAIIKCWNFHIYYINANIIRWVIQLELGNGQVQHPLTPTQRGAKLVSTDLPSLSLSVPPSISLFPGYVSLCSGPICGATIIKISLDHPTWREWTKMGQEKIIISF